MFRRKPPPPEYTVEASDAGVTRFNADRTRFFLFFWDDVTAIETYKIDLLTYDNICVAFCTHEGWHEVTEEDAGFRELMELTQQRYPDIPEDWHFTVMHPAFETNQRTLWRRGPRTTN